MRDENFLESNACALVAVPLLSTWCATAGRRPRASLARRIIRQFCMTRISSLSIPAPKVLSSGTLLLNLLAPPRHERPQYARSSRLREELR